MHGQPRCLRRRDDDDPCAIPAGKTLIGDRNVITEVISLWPGRPRFEGFRKSPNALTSTFVRRSHSRTRAAARFSAARDVAGIPWRRGHSNVTSLARLVQALQVIVAVTLPGNRACLDPSAGSRVHSGRCPDTPPVASRIDTHTTAIRSDIGYLTTGRSGYSSGCSAIRYSVTTRPSMRCSWMIRSSTGGSHSRYQAPSG